MIYFVQDSASCNIKIGFTGNEDVQARVKQLQTGCPGKLMLLGSCAGTQDAERMLHATFADANVGGEWFRPVPTLIQLILSKTAYSLAALAMSNAAEAIHQQQQERQRIETEREVEEKQKREEEKAIAATVVDIRQTLKVNRDFGNLMSLEDLYRECCDFTARRLSRGVFFAAIKHFDCQYHCGRPRNDDSSWSLCMVTVNHSGHNSADFDCTCDMCSDAHGDFENTVAEVDNEVF